MKAREVIAELRKVESSSEVLIDWSSIIDQDCDLDEYDTFDVADVVCTDEVIYIIPGGPV